MGFGGISIWQLLIVLAIIILIFGTKRLRNMGGDLGSAFKGFKKLSTRSQKVLRLLPQLKMLLKLCQKQQRKKRIIPNLRFKCLALGFLNFS